MQLRGSDCIDRTAQHQYEYQGSITGLVTDSQSTSRLNQLIGSSRWEREPKETKLSGFLAHLWENEENSPNAKKIKFDIPFFIHISHLFRNISSILRFLASHRLVLQCHTVTSSKLGDEVSQECQGITSCSHHPALARAEARAVGTLKTDKKPLTVFIKSYKS